MARLTPFVILPLTLVLGGWTSPHQQALEQHRGAPTFSVDSIVGPTPEQIAARAERGDGGPVVMGYLPYWVEPQNIPWEAVDIIAWFGVPTNADGSLGNDHGWGDAEALALIDEAHSVGARVVLSTTRFGGDAVHELLSSPTARANAISNLVDAMVWGGGDGIDIDYEGLQSGDREVMIEFIQDLRDAMDAAQPGSLLTMATQAIDWGGAWDYDVLLEEADVLFIMGYGFHGSWSDPGPIAPLDGGGPWSSRSLRWSAQDYVEWGGDRVSERVVLGLPLYGYGWDADGPDIGAAAIDDAWSSFWVSARPLGESHGEQWEPISQTAWAAWEDGDDWIQLWYETPASIAAKAQMTKDEGLAGFGFFSLNYDEGDAELWDEVATVIDGWDGVVGDDDDDDSATDDDDDSAAEDDDDAVTEDDDDDGLGTPDDGDNRFPAQDGSGCAASVAAGGTASLLLLLPLSAWRSRRTSRRRS